MSNKKNKTNIKDERIEDNTMYGEFVSSFHQWITPDRQRMVARHQESVTDAAAPKNEKKQSN